VCVALSLLTQCPVCLIFISERRIEVSCFAQGPSSSFSLAQPVLQFSFVVLSRASSSGPVRVYHLITPGILPLAFTPGPRPLFSCSRCFYLPRSLISASAPRARPDVRLVVRSAAATASPRFLFAVPSIF
jgi:hypothetical protein